MNLFDFFTDPVLRAPMWGTLLMCASSSLIGVILFLQKRTLLAESLSHATYPGVVIGIVLLGIFFPSSEHWAFLAVLIGALVSSFLALKAISFLGKKMGVAPDAALSFVLSVFFGMGVLATSWMQSTLPSWNKQVQMLLFGQAATMTDIHILLYGALAFFVVGFVVVFFHPLKAMVFDPEFSKSAALPVSLLEKLFFFSLLLSLILGMRSVGVILMSGMVISPAVAARQYTSSLGKMLWLSVFFGTLSGFLGNVLSFLGASFLSSQEQIVAIPTGPMIVLVGSFFAFYALLFAKERGLVFRKLRIYSFHIRCLEENMLKGLWKKGALSLSGMASFLGASSFKVFWVAQRLQRQGFVTRLEKKYLLTNDGMQKSASIVRLHRLWELYLTSMLKLGTDKVHRTAEEMEHILTPEIEEKLTSLLSNPTKDPHAQPIPERVGKSL